MGKTNIEEENTRLNSELLRAKNEIKKLSQKLERSQGRADRLKKELKKNDVR